MSNFGRTCPLIERPRIQFSLREVWSVAALTFLGMALIVPANFGDTQALGCISVVIATLAGALLAFSCSERRSFLRLVALPGCIAFAWTGVRYIPEVLAFLDSLRFDPPTLALALTPVATVTIISITVALLSRRKPWRSRTGTRVFVILSFILAISAGTRMIPIACTRPLIVPSPGLPTMLAIFNTGTGQFSSEFCCAEIGSRETPFRGYLFKVLTTQGEHAPGGQKSYLDESHQMTEGFALVARPSTYYLNGRYTYMVSNSGKIYRADLGPNTAAVVERMSGFDPDPEVWQLWSSFETERALTPPRFFNPISSDWGCTQ